MKRLVVLFVLALVAIFLLDRVGGNVPEGPIRVVTGDPVRVVLPVNASAADIETRTRAAVAEAARDARSSEMAAELESFLGDAESIERVAAVGHQRLSSGEAAALAFPWFRVDAGGDRLTVYSMTVELIPATGGLAISREHEDGHAEVNDQLALRCGPGLADELVAAGRRGVLLEIELANRLNRAADQAHELYHSLVADNRLGSHLTRARDAARQVADGGC